MLTLDDDLIETQYETDQKKSMDLMRAMASEEEGESPVVPEGDTEGLNPLKNKEVVPAAFAIEPLEAKQEEAGMLDTVGYYGDELIKAAAGAGTEVVNNTLQLEADLRESVWEYAGHEKNVKPLFQLDEAEENDSLGGKFLRTGFQFFVPFFGAVKALSAIGVVNKVGNTVTALAAGGVVDGVVFSPEEERVSDMILDWTDDNPVIGKAMFEYLASDPEDTNGTARFKNVLEGMGLGLGTEILFKTFRVVKNHFYQKNGGNALDALEARREARAKEVNEVDENGQPILKEEVNAVDENGQPIIDEVKLDGAGYPILKEGQVLAEGDARATAHISQVAPRARTKISDEKVSEVVTALENLDPAAAAAALRGIDFNFARIDTGDDVKALINEFSERFGGVGTKTQTQDQLRELAEELGAGQSTLKQMHADTENLGARVYAHRALLTASAEEVRRLATSVRLGEGGDDAIIALRKQVALHENIQAQMKGVQSEIGRALSQFRMTSRGVDLSLNERDELLEAMGGRDFNQKFAEKLTWITDPKQLNSFVRKGALVRTESALLELFINNLLSAPATHLINTIGNGLVVVNSIAETVGAAAFSKILPRSVDPRNQGTRAFDAGAKIFGMMMGITDALKITAVGLRALDDGFTASLKGDFKGARDIIVQNQDEFGTSLKAFAKNEAVLDKGKHSTIDQLKQGDGGITAKTFDIDPASLLGHATNVFGTLIRTPGRALMSSDELFKAVHYRGSLYEQAHGIAVREGLTGAAKNKRMAELVGDPPRHMKERAMREAREGTFTNELGDMMKPIQQASQAIPGLRFITPFMRTPVNIFKYTGERTPLLNLFAKSVREEFNAGGRRRDMMLSKTASGTTLYLAGGWLASEGKITGGGETNLRGEKMAGWRPYSVRYTDKNGIGRYASYSRLDPFGAFLGLSADMITMANHAGGDVDPSELAVMGIVSITKNLTSKSYLSGIIQLLDTLNSDNPDAWERFFRKFPATFIPLSAGLGAAARTIDPEKKEVNDWIDQALTKIPYASKSVLPQVNMFGEDMMQDGTLGPTFMSPIYTSVESTNPLATEIGRLNIDLQKPAKFIGSGQGSKGVELSKDQFYRYQKLMGNEAKLNGKGFRDAALHLIKTNNYKKASDNPDVEELQGKEYLIRLMHAQYRKAALLMLLKENPELKKEYKALQTTKHKALTSKATQVDWLKIE